ncbi:MAG: DNA-directed RNA polymerase subunit omega [Pseudomonadota bacterium]|nr:DNA-directed RNA polymerase subunit omega [Pseudomonadota bacterium]
MARVTIEDCLKNIDNAFDIVVLASRRAKDLIEGSEPLVDCKNKPAIVALREIAEAKIDMGYFETSNLEKIENKFQDAILEEEIISELKQEDNKVNLQNITQTTEAPEQTETAEAPEQTEATEEKEKDS